MKKLQYIFAIMATLLCAAGCVGQKDDPEEDPIGKPGPDPVYDESEAGSCLVLEFTGTWCVNCPGMHAAIESAMEQKPGVIVPVAVHCLSLDPLSTPLSDELISRFGISAYPSVVVDFDPGTLFTAASPDLLLARCDQLRKARGKAAALSIKEAWDGYDAISIQVTATVARDGDYTVHLLRLANGLMSPQTGASENYIHNDVLQEWMDAPETFPGLHAGDGIHTEFKVEATMGTYKLVAVICRDGIVDNVAASGYGILLDE